MAGKLTPPTAVYVVIAPTTYDLTTTSIHGTYTDLGAAQEAASATGFRIIPSTVYHHQAGAAVAFDDDTDVEPETKKVKTSKKDKGANGEGAAKRVSKKTAIPEGRPRSLIGRTCMLAGTLHNMDHKTFAQAVEAHGGAVTTKLPQATFLVSGLNPGKRVDEASEKGITVIDEEGFFGELGAEFPEPVAKKAKK